MSYCYPAKTSDSVVLAGFGDELALLLIRRKNPPYEGEYALPGGFLEEGEDALLGALRELKEETDLTLLKEDAFELQVREIAGRDPRGKTISYPFLFWLKERKEVEGQDDAISASWVRVIDIRRMAFDHSAIVCEALSNFFHYMPNSRGELGKNILPEFFKKNSREKDLVFFGGSFNPFHAGHKACVDLFFKFEKRRHLVLVPDFNPWKNRDLYDQTLFFKSYLDLCKTFNGYNLDSYPGFWGVENKNPTYNWFEKVKSRKKGLLFGDDSFFNFSKWYKYRELIKTIDYLYVVPRIFKLHEINCLKNEILKENPHLEIYVLDEHDYQEISSTKIRDGI